MSNPLLSLSSSSSSSMHHHHLHDGGGDHHRHHQEPLYHVDSRIWRACAGSCIDIPSINSRVYYFPQGHIEQSSSPQSLPPSLISPDVTLRPSILCRVTSVLFLADPHTDEVFVKLLLTPLDGDEVEEEREKEKSSSRQSLTALNKNSSREGRDKDSNDKVYSFAKVLTPSDANNGGGFSVPRFCADSIFPQLNYDDDPPVQTLSVTDVRGVVWNFRHIYRGTPRRHLLTTGWSKFVNSKRLVAGDSVVFMKDSKGNVFVGIRRAIRQNVAMGDYSRWRESLGLTAVVEEESNGGDRNSSSGFARKCDEVVIRAVELAMVKQQFEVTYFPRPGCPEFVVRADVVEKARNVMWDYGMRVKMAVETEDSSRITWFQGTVNSAVVPVTGPWKGSLWRMLTVNWDESDVLPNARTVNPWQIEVVTVFALDPSFPAPKKFRCSGNLEVESQDMHYIPFPGFTRSPMGFSIPRMLNPNNFPAGMQGARQDAHNASTHFRYFSDNGSGIGAGNFYGYMLPDTKAGTVSTELNIGSSPSECLSPDTPSSGQCSGVELQQGCNITKPKSKSFQLFGATIHLSDTVQSGIIDGGCASDDSSNGSCGVNGSIKPSDIAPSRHCIQLLQRFDEQGQGDSVV